MQQEQEQQSNPVMEAFRGAGLNALARSAIGGGGSSAASATAPYGYMTNPAGLPVGTMAAPAAPTMFGSATAGAALPFLGVPAGAAVGMQQFQGLGNLASGKNPSGLQHAALLPLTGGFSLAAKPINSMFGRSVGHRQREAERGVLQQTGLGKDMMFNDFKVGTETRDYDDPLTAQAIAYADTVSDFLTGSNDQRRGDMGGILATAIRNGATDDASLARNAADLFQQMGVASPHQIKAHFDQALADGKIDQNRYDVGINNLGRITRVG